MAIVVRCAQLRAALSDRTLLIAVVGNAAPYSHSEFFRVFFAQTPALQHQQLI